VPGAEPARIEGCSRENFSSTLHEAARIAVARVVIQETTQACQKNSVVIARKPVIANPGFPETTCSWSVLETRLLLAP
jgi:hypothetical protein